MISGHRNLPLLLLRTREAAMDHFRPILKRFGLTDQQWRVARVLREAAGGLQPGQIADMCEILSPSLTGILSRMAEMGLVERTTASGDRRRQQVTLTREGRALVDRVLPLIEQQYRLIEAAVGTRTLANVYRTLDKVLATLAQPIPSAVAKVAAANSRRQAGSARRTAAAVEPGRSRPPRRTTKVGAH
jgi:homoprotocatechuate degradation regulator HpaR